MIKCKDTSSRFDNSCHLKFFHGNLLNLLPQLLIEIFEEFTHVKVQNIIEIGQFAKGLEQKQTT